MAATKHGCHTSQGVKSVKTTSTIEIVSSVASAICTKLTVAVPRTNDDFSLGEQPAMVISRGENSHIS